MTAGERQDEDLSLNDQIIGFGVIYGTPVLVGLVISIPFSGIYAWVVGVSGTVLAGVGVWLWGHWLERSWWPREQARRRAERRAELVRQFEEVRRQLDDEATTTATEVDRLQSLIASQEELAVLHTTRSDALSNIFEDMLAKTNREARRRELIFFVLGLAFSIPTGFLVNVLT